LLHKFGKEKQAAQHWDETRMGTKKNLSASFAPRRVFNRFEIAACCSNFSTIFFQRCHRKHEGSEVT